MTPKEANPMLDSKNSAEVKQQDKMFKLFSRPNIGIEDMRKINSVQSLFRC